jgi:hypothetical protein
MSLNWPEPMPETGRLSDSTHAWMNGICLVIDPKMSCPQTLHITLFFDGTNNNDDIDNPCRDSKTRIHTNVARLFNAALDKPGQGIFPFYIPASAHHSRRSAKRSIQRVARHSRPASVHVACGATPVC